MAQDDAPSRPRDRDDNDKEAATARLVEIEPATNTRRTVAENLPIGRTGSPGFPPPNIATGVAVGADGTIYFSANKNNAIYRVRPMR